MELEVAEHAGGCKFSTCTFSQDCDFFCASNLSHSTAIQLYFNALVTIASNVMATYLHCLPVHSNHLYLLCAGQLALRVAVVLRCVDMPVGVGRNQRVGVKLESELELESGMFETPYCHYMITSLHPPAIRCTNTPYPQISCMALTPSKQLACVGSSLSVD